MKRLRHLLWVLLAFSCTTTDMEPTLSVAQPDGDTPSVRYLSPEEAGSIATAFMASLDGDGERSRGDKTRKVSEVSLLNSKTITRSAESDTTFYVVNFEEGGYSLVAADRELDNNVYIYSPDGEFSNDDNPVLDIYLENAIATMPDAPRRGEIGNMAKMSRANVPNDKDLPAAGEEFIDGVWYVYYISGDTKTQGPYLKTKWDQGYPYNILCDDYIIGTNYPAVGCVAIAMGQICAYYKHPQQLSGYSYNWSKINALSHHESENSTGLYDIAHLLANIGKLVNMDYGIQSGASIQDALSGFKEMGYSSASIEDFSSSRCIYSLNANELIYIRGSDSARANGHAWVVDGYQIQTFVFDYYNKETGEPFCTVSRPPSIYLHFNCGWNDSKDDYYYVGTNEPNKFFSTFSFGYDNKIITGLRK